MNSENLDDLIAYNTKPQNIKDPVAQGALAKLYTNLQPDITKALTQVLKITPSLLILILLFLILALIFFIFYVLFFFWGWAICPSTYTVILDRCDQLLDKVVPPLVTYIAGVVTPSLQNYLTPKKQ